VSYTKLSKSGYVLEYGEDESKKIFVEYEKWGRKIFGPQSILLTTEDLIEILIF